MIKKKKKKDMSINDPYFYSDSKNVNLLYLRDKIAHLKNY
jgi:hypothetical protein